MGSDVDKFIDKRLGIDDPGLRQALIVGAGALAGFGVGSAIAGGAIGGVGVATGAATTAVSTAGAIAGGSLAARASAPKLPSLPTLQSGPTVATRIQSESRSAILDLRARLRQSGSRGKSNQGIPQLNPLPSLQGPVLAGKLG